MQTQAERKLAEAARWKERFQRELREFRITTVRMLTVRRFIRRAGPLRLSDHQISVLIQTEEHLHDRRLNAVMNVRTSAACASACDHAARVLFRQQEEGW